MDTRRFKAVLFPVLALSAVCHIWGCAGLGRGEGETPVLLQTATATYLAGDNQAAVRYYTDFLGSDPPAAQMAEGFLGRGNAYYRLGKYTLAEADFQNALSHARDRSVKAQATLGLAHSIFSQQRYEAAEKIYLQVLRSYKGLVGQDEVMYRLGLSLARQAEWEDAEIYLEEVVSRWPAGEFAKSASAKLEAVKRRHFTVQVGAFANRSLADKTAEGLEGKGFPGKVVPIDMGDVPLFTVRSGELASWALAGAHAAKLEAAGFSTYTLP